MIRNTGVCLADIFKWLCHGTVLTALRGAYRFTPAQAAIFIAARQPVSTRAKGSMHPRPARLRLRESALHPAPLRETLLPLLAPLHAA